MKDYYFFQWFVTISNISTNDLSGSIIKVLKLFNLSISAAIISLIVNKFIDSNMDFYVQFESYPYFAGNWAWCPWAFQN